jgi:chaperonin GroES
MKIKPLFDRVLLEPIPTNISQGGIYIPREATERSQIMTVIETGDGIGEYGEKTEMVVTTGDKVLVSKYAGTEIINGTEKYYVLKQCDILAKITEEQK